MKILITGCSGYIGHQLTFYLARRYNFSITGIDKKPPKKEFLPNVTFIEGDVFNVLSKLNENFDIVIHLSAFKDVSSSMEDKMGYIKNNLFLTQLIVDYCFNKNSKLVFTSSSSVYGDNSIKMKEYSKFYPVSVYGFTKLACEYYIQDKLKDFLILRPFNVSGYINDESVWYDYESPNLLFRLIKALMKDETMFLYTNEKFKGIRDYIHVKHLIKIIEDFILEREALPKIVNVCSGTETSVSESVKLIESIIGKKLKFELKPTRPGEVNYLVGNPEEFFKYVKVNTSIYDILLSMVKVYGK